MNPYLLLAIAALSGVTRGQTQDDYCKINEKNTMCLHLPHVYSSNCPTIEPTTVSDDDKEFIVKLHNELRSRVALGLETRGAPGPQPTASNMRALTWDDELALMADTHARQCVYKHDDNSDVSRFAVGQNIAQRSTWPSNGVLNWTSPIHAWYDEVADFAENQAALFTSGDSETGKAIGHYTQVAWANTHKIGCSVINWLESSGWFRYMYVCNYGPSGNIENEPVYAAGEPASACPAGTEANTQTGLCE